jgi:ABC-type branched-subunit amino acid transport system substrate-binding protein
MFKRIIFNVILLIAAFFLVTCSDDSSSPNSNTDKLKVAVITDLSGHYSQFGIEGKQAMELALKTAKNIEVEFFDANADSLLADRLLDTIIKKGEAKVVVTLSSWISNGLAPKIYNNNLLQIAIASAVFNYADLNSCVRFTGDVSVESLFLVEQLKKYNKIAVMYFDNDYGQSWISVLNQGLGSKIVSSVKYIDTQTDFTNELETVKNANPEIIVLISTKEAALITKQARQKGITTKFFGVRPTLTNQLLAEPTADGLEFSYPDLDETNPVYQQFLNQYGYKMSAFGAEGFDLINSLDQFYQNNNKTRDVLFNNFKNKTYNGALGKIKFNQNAQADYDYTLMVIKNGSFEKLLK